MKVSELSNPQIVTICVGRLGGDSRVIDTEDIAIDAFRITPQKFCWKKYPERIDIAIVRFALGDAVKPPKPLLVGNNKDGWMLSPHGLKWTSSLPVDLKREGGTEGKRRGSVLAALDIEKTRLRRSSAFLKFQLKDRNKISLMDFYEFVRINEYFPDRQRRERFVTIGNAVLDDPELQQCWSFLKRKFRKEIAVHEK